MGRTDIEKASQLDQLDQGPRVVLIQRSCTYLPQCGPGGLRDRTGGYSLRVAADIQINISFTGSIQHRAAIPVNCFGFVMSLGSHR
jgi:hypothetical protein